MWRMSSWIVPGKSYTKELFRARRGVNAADLIILSPATVEPPLSETQLPSLGMKKRKGQRRNGEMKRTGSGITEEEYKRYGVGWGDENRANR